MARAIMLMGTGSDVGKSLLCAGLARAFTLRGLKVRPFKPQNMSNNAAVTVDGGEIGRAQALQALAAKVDPTVHMNPVLLKPESGTGAQIIVQGKRAATMSARDYFRRRLDYLPAVLDSFGKLADECDLIIVEGAGSPAETNLRDGDIANMGFAAAASIPALLVGDIHRGGVIASVAGTFNVISAEDAERIKGIIINNFHGDPSLFEEGLRLIELHTKRPCLGVVPHFSDARKLPAEDALSLEKAASTGTGTFRICVPRLARIANFDDLDPLKLEPGVTLTMLQAGDVLPADTDLVILPGSKSTIADLAFLKEQGWDIDIAAHVRRGGKVLGICGGYQMLGRLIHDAQGLEGPPGTAEGLGLLNVETELLPEKTLSRVTARHRQSDTTMETYEIHLGRTDGVDTARAFATVNGRAEGATSPDGRVMGTYLHGTFTSDDFRRAFLAGLGAETGNEGYAHAIEETLDALAAHMEKSLDLDHLLSLAGRVI
ncbi:MAG: cobyric acid synthase [Aestuariivirgaceae bacterium]|nr:cobyric acid synthase [Aestuariivirgaceae bacterium]